MGYRSVVYLKTTSEGYTMMKQMNDRTKEKEDKVLAYAEVYKTSSGNYKICWEDIKWYDSYKQIQNVNEVMSLMDEQEIPYSFIRIGEEVGDVEHRRSYPEDMPYEIEAFEPVVDVNDEEYYDYEAVANPDSML